MKKHYDFSQAVVGKHYCPPEDMELPVYLDSTVRKALFQLSSRTGKDISVLVNDLLRKDIELINSVQ